VTIPDPRADQRFLKWAVDLAIENARTRGPLGGGPFGAVVARDGEFIAKGANEVTRSSDPTAHAEIVAIRQACRVLGTYELLRCVVYASCEPCPMCFSAILWSRADRVVYAASADDAARYDFDDKVIREEVCNRDGSSRLQIQRLSTSDSLRPFEEWEANPERQLY
jgi:guanine deaminase